MDEIEKEIIIEFLFWISIMWGLRQYEMTYIYKIGWWFYKLIKKPDLEEN